MRKWNEDIPYFILHWQSLEDLNLHAKFAIPFVKQVVTDARSQDTEIRAVTALEGLELLMEVTEGHRYISSRNIDHFLSIFVT